MSLITQVKQFSLYMTTSYINSRDINHDVIYICQLSNPV